MVGSAERMRGRGGVPMMGASAPIWRSPPRNGGSMQEQPDPDPQLDPSLDDDGTDTPTGVPPVPGPPPGVPDESWPDGGRPPVNPGVMDPG